MDLKKLLDVHVVTGIVLGIYLGLHYPTQFADYKLFLGIAGLVMGLKVVGVLK